MSTCGWVIPTLTPSSGPPVSIRGTERLYRGHGELRRFWTTFREPWESLHIRVDQVREVGNVVVVLGTVEGHARDGMTVEREAAWDWRFVDDRSIRVKAHATWKEALEAVNVMKKGPPR
jgi:hypothetical protein